MITPIPFRNHGSNNPLTGKKGNRFFSFRAEVVLGENFFGVHFAILFFSKVVGKNCMVASTLFMNFSVLAYFLLYSAYGANGGACF